MAPPADIMLMHRSLGAGGAVALYHRVYTILRERLMSGRYPAEQPLPGELDLAADFGVSRVTMRRALDELKREGLIVRTRGRGSYPSAPQRSAPIRGTVSGLLDNIIAMGLKTSVRIISLDSVAAPPDVAQEMDIPSGSRVQKAVRVRSLDGAPLALMTTWVPETVATFTRRQLSETPMLKLLEGAGVSVAHADQSISAQLADTTVAPLLDLGYGAALLAVNRLVRDDSGRAVQLLRGLYRPDRYEYRMSLDRAGDATRVWVSRDDEHDHRKPASRAPRQTPREVVHA
jgi:GntR family transcriptional regulator